MISRRVLEGLLEQPLGPYRDRDVLHEAACQMSGPHRQLVLYSFVLEHNGQVTGLDESERMLDGRDDRAFRFRGVLKIANPDWLSGFGLKVVETELNLRATERALREGERRAPPLTVEGLFAKGLLKASNDATRQKEDETRLTLLIQGEKNMPAVYMYADSVPHGLLWSSKAHNRNYEVATMDVETYSLSENFFWRWRLLTLMEKITKAYPYIPPNKRTPMWFVVKYIEQFACPREDRHRRLIFDDEDSDVNEVGSTVTPRHLLRPHASEILGLFAAQVEWFITNNEVKRKRLFDRTCWETFAQEVRKERKEASRRGIKWGWPVGADPEGSSDEDNGVRDDVDKLVKSNPVIGKSRDELARKFRAESNRQAKYIKASLSSASESGEDAPCGVQYVSDFSEPSDTEENDSDHRLAEEAVDRIPWQLRQPPLLPDVDGRWWCPLEKCSYQINLHNLTEQERKGVPEGFIRYILQKQWQNAAYDMQVLQGFRYMVTNHYLKHFEEWGVKIERRGRRTQFTLIDGRQRRGGEEPIRGPMPARGTLGGESRVVPIVHAPHFQ